jgi:hypothetical protein
LNTQIICQLRKVAPLTHLNGETAILSPVIMLDDLYSSELVMLFGARTHV